MALTKTTYTPGPHHISGVGPYYDLCLTLVGAGAGKAPTVSAVTSTVSPPCQNEVLSAGITFVSTGVNTVLLSDAYFAVAFWDASVDDVGNTPLPNPTLGQWTNLGSTTSPPVATGFTLSTYNTSFAAADVASGTLIRVFIRFKKDSTGAAA
jgi:hypothetical protein